MESTLMKTLDPNWRRVLGNARKAAVRIWSRPLHRYYTDHTVAHSERVIALLGGLTASMMTTDKRLSPTEVFILLAAAYLHDIGMQDERFAGGNLEAIRDVHHKITAELIYRAAENPAEVDLGLPSDPGVVEAVALVAKGHRRVDLYSPEYEPFAHGDKAVRPRLLAALLRFGDELDIDHRRVDLEMMKLLALPTESQVHWWKCHYVSGVGIMDEYIRIVYRLPHNRPDYQEFIVPLVEVDIRNKLTELEEIFRANAVKVALGPSQARLMRLVQELPPKVEELARQRVEDLPVHAAQSDSLADVLSIHPEHNGCPHKAGPAQWFSRLRIETSTPISGCWGKIHGIRRLIGLDDRQGASLPEFHASCLSWGSRGRSGLFAPISIQPQDTEYLDLAWRAHGDPEIPGNQLRVASALDRDERDTQSPDWGTRQDFIPLEPGYYLLVVQIWADGYHIPVERTYRLHWPGPRQEDSIRLIEVADTSTVRDQVAQSAPPAPRISARHVVSSTISEGGRAMIETIGIPILLKAFDFIFGEGSKILQERRERREADREIEGEDPETASPAPASDTENMDVINSKEEALSQQVSKTLWLDSEAEIEHFVSLLEIHIKNYYLAKEQYAKWGSALVPPIIVNNLTEAEDGVVVTMRDLQAALSGVYGKKVVVSDVEQA